MAMAHRAGMDPFLAVDGADAVDMVERAMRSAEPFQLVLMDMQMPRMDGLEAARRLRELGYSAEALPIVALTANAYSEDIQACLAAGMQAHLAKPVRVRDLSAVLARFVSPDEETTVTSSPVSTKLVDRYTARKMDTLLRLQELSLMEKPDEASVQEATDLLHKLAGVAAMFGEPALGECAKRLEDAILACPPDRQAEQIAAAAIAFREAA